MPSLPAAIAAVAVWMVINLIIKGLFGAGRVDHPSGKGRAVASGGLAVLSVPALGTLCPEHFTWF